MDSIAVATLYGRLSGIVTLHLRINSLRIFENVDEQNPFKTTFRVFLVSPSFLQEEMTCSPSRILRAGCLWPRMVTRESEPDFFGSILLSGGGGGGRRLARRVFRLECGGEYVVVVVPLIPTALTKPFRFRS